MPKEIRHVQRGDFVTSEITSAPTKALEERLNSLENKIRGITENPTSAINFSAIGVGTNNFILNDKTASEEVNLYDAVYYDKNTSKYKSALAAINTSSDTFNTSDSAFVVGIVINKSGNNFI